MWGASRAEILDQAWARVLHDGVVLDEAGVLAVLALPDHDIPAALELAHQVRMRWYGPDVEVEGILSVKTGACPAPGDRVLHRGRGTRAG